MRRSSLVVALVMLVAALAGLTAVASAAEPPYETNLECLECHSLTGSASLKVDFSVPAVDYAACRRCHAAIESMYLHEHDSNCGAGNCHSYTNVVPPSYYSAYGRFQSPASLAATPQQLHAKHVNAARLDLVWGVSGCRTCHAPMTCDSCHIDQGQHGPHAQPAYSAPTYANTNGLVYASRSVSCVNTACHSLPNAGSVSFIPTCLSCHAEKSTSHGGDHSFTSASDYDELTQSGCTNSGAGCHGGDPTYADIRGPYGHLGCLAGPCHTSASKPAEKAPLDCANCHDGTYVGAPDRVSLAGQKPHGHFDSGIHTAGSMDRVMSSGGSASASCAQCHDSVLPGAHLAVSSGVYGSTLGCAECHNDVASGGLSQVSAAWPGRECEGCHGLTSTAPVHAQELAPPVLGASDGCGASGVGCHVTDDLHGLHKDASGCAIAGCHTQQGVPTQRSCGASDSDCHTGYAATHYVAGKHTATGDVTGSFAGVSCVRCHNAVLPTAHGATAAADCVGCHNSASAASVIDAPSPWSGDCAACHAVMHDTFSGGHTGQPVPGNTCLGSQCHPNDSTNLVEVHAGLPGGCEPAGCHDADNADKRPAKMTCGTGGDCHEGKLDGNHGGDHSYTSASDYVDAAETGCTNSGAGCHGTDDAYADMRLQYGHSGCTSGPCHTSASKPSVAAPLDCAKCHAGTYMGAPDVIALTEPAPGGHYPVDLHTSPNGIMTTRYVSAGGSANAACIVCHDRTLPVAHATITSAAYGTRLSCGECHNDLGSGGLLQVRTDWPNKMCEDCHGSSSAAPAHGVTAPFVAGVSPSGCAGSGQGCHATDLHEVHGDATSCLLGCHAKDAGAIAKTCGSADSGCHRYYDTGHYDPVDHTAAGDIDGADTLACTQCHSKVLAPAHSGTAAATCAGCHSDPAAAAIIGSGWDKNCSACHAVRHDGLAGHVGRPASGQTCLGSGCHPEDATDLMQVHSGLPGSCGIAGCHDLASKDDRPVKKSCGTGGDCHEGKLDGNHGGDHSYTRASDYSASTEAGCTNSGQGCHGVDSTFDIRVYHQASGCQDGACHDRDQDEAITPPDECSKCHAGGYRNAPDVIALSDASPGGHYPEAAHTASAMTRVLTAGGTASANCSACHDAGLKAAHATSSVSGSPYGSAVSCHECHNDTRSNGLTQVGANWSTNTCDDCHTAPGSAPMHGAPPAVAAVTTGGCTNGAACHGGELHSLHRNAPSCALSGCHTVRNIAPSARSCGSGGACHVGVTGSHRDSHDTAGVVDAGCFGCHFRYLDDEHLALGSNCASCHASSDPTVSSAIAADDRRCATCHPGSSHNARQAAEFAPGNASMHRVRADLPGMRSSFTVGGASYTWTLPSASSFLKIGYTTNSMVLCSDCHTYSGATGPHGSTMKVNIDPAYPTDYNALGGESATVQLSNSSPTGMSSAKSGGAVAGVICEKCHDLFVGSSFSNVVHKEHDDRGSDGAYCSHCHVAVPHGWGRPRMLAYTTDSAPYRTSTGGLQRVSVKSYTPNSWTKSDCGAGCSSGRHPLSGTAWPNQMTAPPQSTPANLARTGTAAASSTYSSSNGASKAIDGSTSTYWRPSSTGTQWLRVDLGSSKSVSKVIVNWSSTYYARGYRIETSADGSNWTTQYSTSSGTSGVKTHSFTATSARYVRLYCTSAASTSYRVNELEVWDR